MHEPDGGPELVGQFLEDHRFEIVNHVVTKDRSQINRSDPFPALADFELLIVGGSERSLTRKDEIDNWVHDELGLIREAHASGVPILGICFGGQMVAEALGGSVEVAPVTEIGWFGIEGSNNPVGPGPWFQWHHDRFFPPTEAEVLATNENAVQMYRIGTTVGMQFHPEVTERHLKVWTEFAPDSYLESYGVSAEQVVKDAAVHAEHNFDQTKALVEWFVDEVIAG